MRFATFALALTLLPSVAWADRWLPYTDGRVGGCFINSNGILHGCTPQPPQIRPESYPSRPPPSASDHAQSRRNAALEAENQQLRRERATRLAEEDVASAGQEQQRRAFEDAYFELLRRKQIAREQQWRQSRNNCNSASYETTLKTLGLKKHPSVKGICVSIEYKASQECPPCR